MPIDDSKYRMREKARETGNKVKQLLDNYVRVRRNGDDLFRKTEILWRRIIAVGVVLIFLSVLAVWLFRR